MDSKREHEFLKVIRCPFGDENGVVLMVVLIFVGILALVGATATIMSTTDTKIGANYKTAEQALYVAEAGAHEARERLRVLVDNPIPDDEPGNHLWKRYIGTEPKSQDKGFDIGSDDHERFDSLQTGMDYIVVITHQLDTEDTTKVLYWGDNDDDGEWTRNTTTGENIYLITSYGNTVGGSAKTIQLEVTRVPPITVKGAWYSGSSSSIRGNVEINGQDRCGGGTDLPGISTPLPKVSDTDPVDAGDLVDGAAEFDGDEGDPNVKYSEAPALDVPAMADFLKKSADFSYNLSSETHTAATVPGPGDDWGDPDIDSTQPTCDSYNIVHYDTNGTSIHLSGKVLGCGILVVEGDLYITGGFKWFGTVIVTGALDFSGGGTGNNVMGAVITGGLADGDEDEATGKVKVDYCSTATEDQNKNHSFLSSAGKKTSANKERAFGLLIVD